MKSTPTRMHRIAVIGAGNMGRAIAYVCAASGIETTLEDIRPATLEEAMEWFRRNLREDIQSGKLSPGQARQALARLRGASGVEEASDADLVIDATPEEMELKIELFGMLDKLARAETILATCSCSLSIAEMAKVTQRPERCIGMRFLDPVMETKGVELVCAPETSQETLQACRDLAKRMGKDVILRSGVRDSAAGSAP